MYDSFLWMHDDILASVTAERFVDVWGDPIEDRPRREEDDLPLDDPFFDDLSLGDPAA